MGVRKESKVHIFCCTDFIKHTPEEGGILAKDCDITMFATKRNKHNFLMLQTFWIIQSIEKRLIETRVCEYGEIKSGLAQKDQIILKLA